VIFGQDRDELRRMYSAAWYKSRSGELLTPLEAQIAKVIEEHKEYQLFIESSSIVSDFSPMRGESNPWLHMGLHLAIREQVATDRPAGIRAVFERLRQAAGSAHTAEHQMLECLAECLWQAQRNNALPDETLYLERLKRIG
jgi:hypothetical protein